jgi:endonuclease III
MPDLQKLIARLQKHYGAPELPPARGAFELVLWENACYLLPDHRRAAVFEGLRAQVGLTPDAIGKAPREVLLPLAALGGMRPETRVFRWQEIARITATQFQGNLEQILEWPYARAMKALKLFPCIGDPGAEKILLFCGLAAGLPLESNGLRVLTRIGYGRVHLKNYGAMYRSVQEAIAPELPKGAQRLARAHLLLRAHGKTICRDKQPACHDCPVEDACAFRNPGASKGPRNIPGTGD